MFAIKNFSVAVGGKNVVRDVSCVVGPGEIHALMGPNGSGKSSLASAIAGHPEYRVVSGTARLGDVDLLALTPEARARAGLFLSFQEPPEVGGVSVGAFLKIINGRQETSDARHEEIAKALGLDPVFFNRFLNEGFSGGEKKKSELLQFFARAPRFAIFDEIDTGLDAGSVDALISMLRSAVRDGVGALVISHSEEFLAALNPVVMYQMENGVLTIKHSHILKNVRML